LTLDLFLPALIVGLQLGAFYCLISLGMTLMYGIMGVLNMAHGTVYMVGAVAAFYVYSQAGVNFYLSLVIVAISVGVVGIIAERFLIRPAGGELGQTFVITVGLWLGLEGLALLVFGPVARGIQSPVEGALHVSGIDVSAHRILVIFVAALIVGGVYYLIHRTKVGLAMRAVEEDKVAAAIQGVSIDRLNALVFFIGFSLAAAAGVLMAPAYSISSTIGFVPLAKAFMIIALGGLGSIPGAILGSLLLGLADSFLGVQFGASMTYILTWILIIVILLFRPRGLMGAY
jgi:branched-chain amino acid transport system permease protein